LHPAEALHGDLGRLQSNDVLLALSNSGETEELVRLLKPLHQLGVSIIAVVGNSTSSLARAAEIILSIGDVTEACPIGLAPTTSTTTMLALGDALAMTLMQRRRFSRHDFARFHPAGHIGRRLLRVAEVMRTGARNPVVHDDVPLLTVLKVMTQTPGRPGVASIVDADGKLLGIFTDGDLRRLLERDGFNNQTKINTVMTPNPKSIRSNATIEEAENMLGEFQIDNVPVVDEHGKLVGLLDVQDLLSHESLS